MQKKRHAHDGGESMKIEPPKNELRHLGYEWIEQSIEEALSMLKDKLEKQQAKAWVMDVYTSNHVYRNIVIKYIDELNDIREIEINFKIDKESVIYINSF